MPEAPTPHSERSCSKASEADVAAMRAQIAARRETLCPSSELRASWDALLHGLCERQPAVAQIWCLGIGPFSHPASAYQWAVLQEFQNALETHHQRAVSLTVYDPQFESRDVALVHALGAHLPLRNEVGVRTILIQCGAYSFTGPTLLYMPHCPKELYENFLRANWDHQRLQTLVLCGNELDMYAPHESLPCISRLAPYVQSYRLPPMQTHVPGALDAAVQVFFSSLPHVPPTTNSDDGFYQATPRKARTRARRGQSASKPTPPPLRSEDPAFWQLPPPAPVGEEVLTTPVPDGVL